MQTLNRRAFVQRTLSAGAAAAVLPAINTASATATAVAPEKPLKISVLSYSFRGLRQEGKMDVFGYLETVKYRYNLNAADFWHAFIEKKDDEAYLRKIREAMDEKELSLANIAVDGPHLWEDDPAEREQHYKDAMTNLRAAAILKPYFVRIDAGGTGNEWTNEQFDYIVKRYKEYAQFAHDNGFLMGAENHMGPEKLWTNLKRLYDAVDHPAFGISNHIGSWGGTAEEKDLADRESAPIVRHTHIAYDLTVGPDLERKLGYLWNAGYPGYYSAEHHSGQNEYANVGIQLAHVRRVLEQFQKQGGTVATAQRS